jgi:hypothetical protein
MKIIVHRRNTISELLETDPRYGVEVDIRSTGHTLTVHHDPFSVGESFEAWLNAYQHGTLILNVKEEGLEVRLINLMAIKGIDDYFFLDQSFPILVKLSSGGERRCAVRVSEFEAIDTALNMAGKANWIWVDCFTRFALTDKESQLLKHAGFKLCIVSPELQGRDADAEIPALASLLNRENIQADAVCTKRPDLWESTFRRSE